MDQNRQSELRPIVRTLKCCRRAGVVHVAPLGRRFDAGYSIPWPIPGPGRRGSLVELIDRLSRLGDGWRVYFVEDGADGAGAECRYAWPWPDAPDLFTPSTQAKDSYPHWAFEGEVATEAEPAKEAPPQAQAATAAVAGLLEDAGAAGVPLGRGSEMEGERRVRFSDRCAQAALDLLAEADRRLTLTEIGEELESRGVCSQTTVNHTLPEMRRRGAVDNAPMPGDRRGVGYGLPGWEGK